jgi:glycerol-3-phosphate acyltransferase PlsY
MLQLHPAILAIAAYVVGSIPAALIAGQLHGVDIRTQGSGNLGATNVVRVLGWKTGLAVFLFDAAKGALPVLLFPAWTASTLDPRILAVAYGLAAVAGHVRPVFLKFGKGGKGVATATGVFAGLAPIPMLITFAIFVVVVLASGYVSLGSLISAVILPAVLLYTAGPASPIFVVSVILAAFVFWTHRANIGRLRRGEEHRFGKRAAG